MLFPLIVHPKPCHTAACLITCRMRLGCGRGARLSIRLCLACRNLEYAKCIGPSSISTKCICPSATELNQHEAKSTGPSTTERKGPSTTALPRSTPPQPKDDKNSRDQDRTTSCIKSERCSCMPWQPPWPPRKNGRRSLASLWLGLGLRHRLPQGREVAWSLHEVQHAVHPKLRVHVWVRTQVMPVVEHHLERHPNLHIPKSAPYIGSLACCEVPQRPADRNSNN